jgi:sialate O-acetylesterase
MPAIFSDGAVLQKTDQVPVWGWGSPGEDVSVKLAGASASAKADDTGKWSVVLDLSDAGAGPHELTAKAAQDEITIRDVLVGEVWLCSGQSNMEMRLRFCDNAGEIGKVNNPEIRHFKVERASSEKPLEDLTGKWIKAQGSDLGEFTAVGYHFAKNLQEQLGCPVGLINSSHGGSVIETWVAEPVLQSHEDFQKASIFLDDLMAKQGKDEPNRRPFRLFNGMIAPLVPYAVAGILWYQGESNVREELAPHYVEAMKAMLNDWRKRWNRPDLPFYFCQLPSFNDKVVEPGREGGQWTKFRDRQGKMLSEPNTGMVVLIDAGEAKNIHPQAKHIPGERLAKLVLAKTYGRDVVHAGPSPMSYEVKDGTLRIRFKDTHGGLIAKPLPESFRPNETKDATVALVRNSPDGDLEGFELCSTDGKWAWAKATIDGDSVLVSARGGEEPVTVRYAWADNPTCNLYNGEGFPAAPFQHQLSSKSQAPHQ